MRARSIIMLSVSLMVALLAAPAQADGYMTARGLYDDCSAGARPGLDPERQEQRRKCQNFLRAVAVDWVLSFPAETLPADPIACPQAAISAWEANYGPVAEEVEAIMRTTLGDELYDRVRSAGSVRTPLRLSYDGDPEPFLEYWDGNGFAFLVGFTTSARSAVLEFLDARMVVCSSWRFLRPVDPNPETQ